ncbi:hypothetical protein HK100_005977 [Physocladia obscura]|uniref:Arginine biosynthesis bifunctional protein ArgJ, mitochondrial n=1 Tax=Physocladia obscura TaxID=109957 RepID=A0AAD5STJ8_9FUNG|nr:hypothetical protein HK100_005977 [Physocladia obscura]
MRRYSTLLKPAVHPKQVPTSGTYPLGFRVAAVNAGLKKNAKALDMALVVSDTKAAVGAVFTKNAFAAAPVIVARQIVADEPFVQAVLVNAGQTGLKDANAAIVATDKALNFATSSKSTIMLSTGVIGVPLKMDKILAAIPKLAAALDSSHASWLSVATGIMTTDTFPKLRSREFIGSTGKSYRMAGWAKGAGMIHPNMGTMLGGIFTDAAVAPACLKAALGYAVERSFNAISVDGDTSTNDSLVVLANGAANGAVLMDNVASEDFIAFRDNLTVFAAELAGLIVRDGEGATKFLDIQVENAKSFEDAKAVASSIARSPLVKTAMFGQDANWGRIICAVGYSGVDIDPTKVNLRMETRESERTHEIVHLFKDGAPFEVFSQQDKDKAKRILAGEDIVIRVDLGIGNSNAQMYTCDLTFDYVKINIDYT